MARPLPILALLLLLAPLAILAGLASGSAGLSWQDLAGSLFGDGSPHQIVWQLRAPRVLSAFACGGLLAVAGVLLQVLLRNPLADPYILGISGGASVGALGAMLLGFAAGMKLAALGGAFAAVALVLSLSLRRHAWDMHYLLLTGVVLSAGCGALISLMLTLAPAAGLHGMLFWLMGDLSFAATPGLSWAALAVAGAVAWFLSPRLNILTLGEFKAKSLGVAVRPLQGILLLTASGATAMAVLEGGSIGFVGLLIPHLLRLIGISDHRWLIPASLLLGGSFLSLADTLARTLLAPQQLPVGVVTALLGVPALLYLLTRRS